MAYHSGNHLLDPQIVFGKSHLRAGMHVADFGCGRTGHLVFQGARIVGERGIYYAVDIMKDVLENINKRAQMEGLINVHPVWSDIESLGGAAIPERSLDMVMIVNVLSKCANKNSVLLEASRLLSDKGRIVIVDWLPCKLPMCPPEEKILNFEEVAALSQKDNLHVQEIFDAGPYHRGMILYRNQ